MSPSTAPYDEIADWYERDFLRGRAPAADEPGGDPIGIDAALGELLGPGAGTCLEIGCGTGIHAARVRSLGRTPVGVELSAGMARYAGERLPVARADAARLPIATGSVPAVVAVMVHTDMPSYPDVLHEVRRVLRPDGVFVHVGVHPCFTGGFADRSDREAVVIGPGYLDTHWTTRSWTTTGLRDKVGATHRPVAELLNALLAAGLAPVRFAEGGAPLPDTLSWRAVPIPAE